MTYNREHGGRNLTLNLNLSRDSESESDAQGCYEADVPDLAPKASVADLGYWVDLLLL